MTSEYFQIAIFYYLFMLKFSTFKYMVEIIPNMLKNKFHTYKYIDIIQNMLKKQI